jgi:hypothetical protein
MMAGKNEGSKSEGKWEMGRKWMKLVLEKAGMRRSRR